MTDAQASLRSRDAARRRRRKTWQAQALHFWQPLIVFPTAVLESASSERMCKVRYWSQQICSFQGIAAAIVTAVAARTIPAAAEVTPAVTAPVTAAVIAATTATTMVIAAPAVSAGVAAAAAGEKEQPQWTSPGKPFFYSWSVHLLASNFSSDFFSEM